MKHVLKAVGLTRYLPITEPESIGDVDRPSLGRTHSVNPVDSKFRRSIWYEASRGLTACPGLGCRMVVKTAGEDVRLFQPGDEVYYSGNSVRPGCTSVVSKK